MKHFFKGLLLGTVLSILLAPLKGEHMRRLLQQRLMQLLPSQRGRSELENEPPIQLEIPARSTPASSVSQASSKQETYQNKQLSSSTEETKPHAAVTNTMLAQRQAEEAKRQGTATPGVTQKQTGEPKQQGAATNSTLAQKQTNESKRQEATTSSTLAQKQVNEPKPQGAAASSTLAQRQAEEVKRQGTATPGVTQKQAGEAKRQEAATNNVLVQKQAVDPELQTKLEEVGIRTTEQLLERTETQKERSELAQELGTSAHQLKQVSLYADLMRLQGCEKRDVDLLEEAGVRSSKDLCHRNPEHLYSKLREIHKDRHASGPMPTRSQVEQWIAQAKTLTQEDA